MRRRPACASAGRLTTAAVLLSLLAGLGSSNNMAPPPPPPPPPHSTTATRDFSLRHVFHHGTDHYPQLHRRLDVPQQSADADADAAPGPRLRVKAAPLSIERLADRSREAVDGLLAWARSKGRPVLLAAADWTVDEVPAPNVTDRDTVLSLARMASDAYIPQPHTGEWQDVGGGFNYSDDFGWEADGLRGHIFADPHNATVVIGLKGTSPAMFDGSETTTKDKVNDNLFFSCCCGQGGQFLWRQVCDCQTSALTCNATCLATALRAKNHYYYAAQDLYHNVTGLYPNAEIWLAGHSLGGAVASLLSLTFGHPAVTFEAVPEAMPASRLGLPVPPGHQIGSLQQKRPMTGGFHFGHTADPIYMGQCNQATSVCTIGGYAMQSVCHTGMKCVYDTVKDFGWRVGIGTHKIVQVIHDVLEKYDAPAKCEPYLDCTDCYAWKYFESNGTETTTSHISKPTSTSTSTPTSKSKPNSRTRTETCKTPGWWGCLDESTSHAKTSSKTTSTWSTSTCKTPGWFGCKDDNGEKTSSKTKHTASPVPAPTVTTTSPSPTSTSSCRYPGWFGDCLDGHDPPSRTTVRTSTASPTAFTSSCTHEGWFGLICYDKTKKHSTSSTSAASSPCCTSDGWSGLVCYDKSKKHQHTMTERLEM